MFNEKSVQKSKQLTSLIIKYIKLHMNVISYKIMLRIMNTKLQLNQYLKKNIQNNYTSQTREDILGDLLDFKN